MILKFQKGRRTTAAATATFDCSLAAAAKAFYTGLRLIKWPTSNKLNIYALQGKEKETKRVRERGRESGATFVLH